MKKIFRFISVFTLFPLLASCSEVKAFEWWDTENVTITKNILYKTANDAYLKARTNRGLLGSSKTSNTFDSFYKDYLGNFASETDANTNVSETTFIDRYSNDVTVTKTKNTTEKSFKNAHTNGVTTTDTYKVGYLDKKQTLTRSIVDYGYGDAIGTESLSNYNTDIEYQESLFINVEDISDWDHATYGLAKNNMILIEESRMIPITYIVPFSGLEIKEAHYNIYSLFRISKLNEEYIFDYYHQITSLVIAKDEFGNQLNEPFTLEKSEVVTRFYDTSKGLEPYDISSIPVIPE